MQAERPLKSGRRETGGEQSLGSLFFIFLNKKEPKLFPLLKEALMSGNELVF